MLVYTNTKITLPEFSLFQEFDDLSEDVENTIPESCLISLVKKLEEEVIIQDIPKAPIIVYLEDKETHALIGIKIKDEGTSSVT